MEIKKEFLAWIDTCSGNPKYRGEGKEVKTGGGGAFAGFILGVALGLLFGPIFAIIGGILGAFLGNSLEKFTLKDKRKFDLKDFFLFRQRFLWGPAPTTPQAL